jgi:hypothetical protein
MADYVRERDMKYGMIELMVSAVLKSNTDMTVPTPSPTTLGELMQTLDIDPRLLQMPKVTSRPGSSQIRLGSEKPQTHSHIAHPFADMVSELSQLEVGKSVEPVSFYRCI